MDALRRKGIGNCGACIHIDYVKKKMLNSQSKNFRVSLMSTLAKFEEGSTSQL